ncbi:MAG: hypothetical protein A2075_14220 [Geobacteraceae bacterium GWC2_58_44]|nr:MAG: hypothetical protein A2075_14220 [Geobacteraceae bacterium GWC2_58_44]HBG04527.1 hypothetical protein [Geobacter sp.]
MEFFTVYCLRKGRVFIDGSYLGENKNGETLRVFQCGAGLHDISLECQFGRKCREMRQRVMITGTNAILPRELRFFCDL